LALLAPAVVGLVVWAALSRRERLPLTPRVLAGVLLALVVASAPLLWWWLSGRQELIDAEPVARSWLHPFVALEQAVHPPRGGEAPAAPAAYGGAVTMLVLSVVLNGWGILWLRVWNPSGEPIMQRESPEDADAEEKDRLKAHAAPGKVRQVWANPILW